MPLVCTDAIANVSTHWKHAKACPYAMVLSYKNPHHAFLQMGSCRVGEYHLDKI